jgi:aspartyl-tRNA(Asn)/glutamyl-tRNA(Gln) amidotransferase subunit A
VGVFGATVNDAARGMEAIAGRDDRDSTSADRPVSGLRFDGSQRLDGVVVGRPREYFPESLDARMRERVDAAIDVLRDRGAVVKEVSLGHTDLAIPVYYIIATAEASSNLARFDGVRYGSRDEGGDGLKGMYEATRSRGFGPEVTRRILLGTYVLSAGYYDAYYRKAQQVRTLITRDFGDAFDNGVDVILTPTTPTTAFEIGARAEPYEMYLNDIFTATANLAGVPAMSVPVGAIDGLPVGAQIIARHFEEAKMFRIASVLENALGVRGGVK